MIINPIGVLALSRREIHRFVAVANQTIYPPIVSSALYMYILGVAVGGRIDFSSTGLSYLGFIVPGLMTLYLILSAYENTSSSLFIARWHNHIQEVLLAPLSYFEMVLGLLAGGVLRGFIVCLSVFLVSLIFEVTVIAHPVLLVYFTILIAVIFSCAGMMAALWAEDFGMLSMWNIYIIAPLVLLGGVFHPVSMLPEPMEILSKFNPMYFLVNGIRYSITGHADTNILFSVIFALGAAVAFFFTTVYLFKIGYKLRT